MYHLDDIRARHSIVSVLERLGHQPPDRWNGSSNFLISCPNPGHEDRSPSCSVRPSLERFHCFGCGAHGDVFDLVQQVAGMRSLGEAVQWVSGDRNDRFTYPGALAVDTREPCPDQPVPGRTTAQRILDVNRAAWCELTTPAHAAIARRYLLTRGIDLRDLEVDGQPLVGYTPAARVGLTQVLLELGYASDECIDAGWTVRRDDMLFDRFHRRVAFPIRGRDGELLAVTARDVSDRARSKYINTPTTAVYRKSHEVYVPIARGAFSKGRVAVCEGPVDALALAHREGLAGPAAALCGTAMSGQQARRVSELGNGVILWSDGDVAGRAAAGAWAEQLAKFGVQAGLRSMPNGLDPASWLHGQDCPSPSRVAASRSIGLSI